MKSPRKAMLAAIRSFAVLAIVLASISAGSNAVDAFFGSAQKSAVAELEGKLKTAKEEIKSLEESGVSHDTINELETQLASATEEIKQLKDLSASESELAQLRSQLDAAQRTIQQHAEAAQVDAQITTEYVAELLLSDFSTKRVREKQEQIEAQPDTAVVDPSEVSFRILERAVFDHVAQFHGDAGVLSRALEHLLNRGRTEIEDNQDRLIDKLPQIMQLRLRWLEDEAIPALRADLDYLRERPMEQRDPTAAVPIPEELWLFKHPEGSEPTETVTDMAKLEAELKLLKSVLG